MCTKPAKAPKPDELLGQVTDTGAPRRMAANTLQPDCSRHQRQPEKAK
jgi:hypothetical protein